VPFPSLLLDGTESWEDYLSRNKSFLVSQFQGQLKSTVRR